MKSTSWIALASLVAVGGYVVYSSLRAGGVRCEVCIEFEGARACRSVDAGSEEEALAGARTNACALLAAGVTKTLACGRTPPVRSGCQPL